MTIGFSVSRRIARMSSSTCCGAVQAVQAARAAYTFALFLIQDGRTAFCWPLAPVCLSVVP